MVADARIPCRIRTSPRGSQWPMCATIRRIKQTQKYARMQAGEVMAEFENFHGILESMTQGMYRFKYGAYYRLCEKMGQAHVECRSRAVLADQTWG